MSAWTTLFEKCRVLIICVPFALLAACGGSQQQDNDIATCVIGGCAESNTLGPTDIQTSYTVTQSGSDVHIVASLGKSGNLFSVLRLSAGDTLTATIGNQSVPLNDTSGGYRTQYVADINTSQSQPVVTVNFTRSGASYGSTVTVPTEFTLLSANSISTTLASGSFGVELSPLNSDLLTSTATGSCTRVDGTSFNFSTGIPFSSLGTVSGGVAYKVSTSDLDAALNQQGKLPVTSGTTPTTTPLVQTCNFQLVWGQTRWGTTPSAMSEHSSIVGETSVTQQVFYNAQH
jgi:hypothetical protein